MKLGVWGTISKGSKPWERETLLPPGGNREGLGEKAASELGLRGGDTAMGMEDWCYTFAEQQVRTGDKSSIHCVTGESL